jgi:hypothetical protein
MLDVTNVNRITNVDRIKVDRAQVIERVKLVALLGLRFWDEVSGKTIGDGLVVTTYPATRPERRVRAVSNLSGIYLLRHLPGLREFENAHADTHGWDSPPSRRLFVIEVVDDEERFQPFLMTTHLPGRDIFVWEDLSPASPPGALVDVPLYSTSTRTVPAAMAVLRADLWDPTAGPDPKGGPAAWAVIEARLPGQPTVRGIADDNGHIALIFPYPDPGSDALGSPPDSPLLSPLGGGSSLRDQQWTIKLQAAYKRLRPVSPLRNVPALPDLGDVLTQPPAILWTVFDRTELTARTLAFGKELVVKSDTFIEGSPKSVLYITPAGSPP